MKRKQTYSLLDNLRHKFPPTPLYRADLDAIIEIAKTRELGVQISDKDYEYESLDDLRQNKGDRVRKLTLTLTPEHTKLASITVEFDADGVRLRSSRDDRLVPVWHEIREAIAERTPWYARFMRPGLWTYLTFIPIWLSSKTDELPAYQGLISDALIAIASAMLIITVMSFLYLHRSRGIYLQREHEVQGIWARYGEKILMLVIGAILGVVAKFISDKLSGQ